MRLRGKSAGAVVDSKGAKQNPVRAWQPFRPSIALYATACGDMGIPSSIPRQGHAKV